MSKTNASRIRLVLPWLGVLTIACSGSDNMAAPLPPPVPKHILVKNYLLRPLTLTSGNTGYGTVGAGIAGILLYGSVTITLPGSATSLTYVMQPYQYSDGSAVPNDLTGETVSLGTDSSYEL